MDYAFPEFSAGGVTGSGFKAAGAEESGALPLANGADARAARGTGFAFAVGLNRLAEVFHGVAVRQAARLHNR